MPTAFTEQKFGFSNVDDMIASIQEFLTVTTSKFTVVGAPASDAVLLAATNAVDPLLPASPQPSDLIWAISLSKNRFQSSVAQPDQLIVSWGNMQADGDPTFSEIGNGQVVGYQKEAFMSNTENPNNDTRAISPSALHGYRCTVTNRGMTLAVFSQRDVESWKGFGLFTIQRPVDCDGVVLTDRKAPLFAVWNSLDAAPADGMRETEENQPAPLGDGDTRWFKSVVREDDVFTATTSAEIPGGTFLSGTAAKESKAWNVSQVHFENKQTLYAWPTSWSQPITQDNNEIPLIFPFGLTTNRFAYLEELDQTCVGPACVFTFGQVIDVTVFGEPRKYQMLTPSKDCNGVVVGVLVDGPEFI